MCKGLLFDEGFAWKEIIDLVMKLVTMVCLATMDYQCPHCRSQPFSNMP